METIMKYICGGLFIAYGLVGFFWHYFKNYIIIAVIAVLSFFSLMFFIS